MSKTSTLVSLPPGPESPPSHQARQWIERPLDLLDECSRQFGDAFTLQLGNLGATVMFSHPESVKTIFRARQTYSSASSSTKATVSSWETTHCFSRMVSDTGKSSG